MNQQSARGGFNGGARGGFRENIGNQRGGRRTRFSGLNVVYDEDGIEYQVDENGVIILDFEEEEFAAPQQNKNLEN